MIFHVSLCHSGTSHQMEHHTHPFGELSHREATPKSICVTWTLRTRADDLRKPTTRGISGRFEVRFSAFDCPSPLAILSLGPMQMALLGLTRAREALTAAQRIGMDYVVA